MKRNLILMSALFAGSMIVNDGFGGFKKFRRDSAQMHEQPQTPMLQQTPVQPQNTPQNQPAGNAQSANTPLNDVGCVSTSASVYGLPIPEEDDDVMGRSYSTPPVVGGGIFQNLDGHQDVSEEPYVESPGSPNLGNGTRRTAARRNIDLNYGSGKRPRMDSFVFGGNSVPEGTTGGNGGEGSVNGGDGNTDTGYTPGVPPSVFNITAIISSDDLVRSKESVSIGREIGKKNALFKKYVESFLDIANKIISATDSATFDRYSLLRELEEKIRCFIRAPEPGRGDDIPNFKFYRSKYDAITNEITFMSNLVHGVAMEVNGIIEEIWGLDDIYAPENKIKLLQIVDIINEKLIVSMVPTKLLKGLNFEANDSEGGDFVDYKISRIQIDDMSLISIPVESFRGYFMSIVNVLEDARNLNIDLNIVNMAANIVTKVRDREMVLRGHDCLVCSYVYILQKYFMNFFESVLKSMEDLRNIAVRTHVQSEQLELLRNLEARICERNRDNPERIDNIVMNEVFNVVSRRIEQEKARVRAENAPNDPEVYQVGDTKYSSGTLREAAAEVTRIYNSITNARTKKSGAYGKLSPVANGNNGTLHNLQYGENTDEVRTVWENALKMIKKGISDSKIIAEEFRKTNNQFLKNNLRL